MTVFHNESGQKRKVAFAAPYRGKIQPLHLAELGGELLCQKDSFLCAAKGVTIGIAFTKRFGAGLFGREGFILQRLQGDGWAFVHAGARWKSARSACESPASTPDAWSPSSLGELHDIRSPAARDCLFGGEGLFFAIARSGRGPVAVFSRLASRTRAARRPGAAGASRARSWVGSATCSMATDSRTTRHAPSWMGGLMRRGGMVVASVGAFLIGATVAAQQRDFSKVEITTQKVAEGIYMMQGAGGNVGVSAGPDGVLLIDTSSRRSPRRSRPRAGKISDVSRCASCSTRTTTAITSAGTRTSESWASPSSRTTTSGRASANPMRRARSLPTPRKRCRSSHSARPSRST
jgi:uncharacterized protein (AIM24 family)